MSKPIGESIPRQRLSSPLGGAIQFVRSLAVLLGAIPAFLAGGGASPAEAAEPEGCRLYPMALSWQSVSNLSAGATLNDLLNGSAPGNFGWLTWGGSPSVPTLVTSLTPPGDSATYVNPDNPQDHQVSVGDWVQGKPGVSNSKNVRDALDALKSLDLTVPVWDAVRGQGANAAYRVAAFARVRLVSYQLPSQNRISARFLGWANCGAVNLPPTVNAGADLTLPQFAGQTVAGTLTGVVTDDGLPAGGQLSASWTQLSGPALVAFTRPGCTNLLGGVALTNTWAASVVFGTPGTYVFRFAAGDGHFSASDDLIVTVNRLNRPPVAANQSVTNHEDSALDIVLAGGDPDGDALSFTVATQPQYGGLTGTAPNLRYTPKADWNGADSFQFAVSDGLLTSSNATVTITILPVNDSPVADSISITNYEDTTFPIALSGSDVEGSPLTGAIVTSPLHGNLKAGTAHFEFTYTPNSNYFGSDTLVFKVNDGTNDSAPALVQITVLPVDDLPLVHAGADQTILLPTNMVFLTGEVVYDFFPGAVDSVIWSQVSGPGDVVFGDPRNEITTAAFSRSGVYQLRLTASDSFLTNSDDLVITVNAPPLVSAGPAQTNTLPDGVTLSGGASDDGVPPGGMLTATWSQVSGPGAVVFGDPAATNTTAAFSRNGLYVLRLTVDDGLVAVHRDVTVLMNQAPIVNAGSDQVLAGPEATLAATVYDDGWPNHALRVTWSQKSGPGTATFADAHAPATTVAFDRPGVYVLELSADDSLAVSSDEVTVVEDAAPVVNATGDRIVTWPATANLAAVVTDDGWPRNTALTCQWTQTSGPGTVTFSPSSSLTPQLTFSAPGVYEVQFSASDSLLTTVTNLTVMANRAPVVEAEATSRITPPHTAALNGSVSDDGLPSGTLTATWSKVSGPGDVVFANPASAVTTAGFTIPGWYVLRLTADDSAADSHRDVTLRVNAAPAARNQNIATLEDQPVNGAVTADDAEGDILTYALQTPGGRGAVVMNANGAFTYTPSANTHGPDTFTFTVSDGQAAATGTVTVTIAPVNDAPVALNQTITLDEDSTIPVVLSGSDPDGDALTFAVSRGPTNGLLSGTAPYLTYTPFTNYHGADGFTYVADDGVLTSAVATVTITVLPVNDAPFVEAGSDQFINLPLISVVLRGRVDDEAFLEGQSILTRWSLINGPGTATFSDTNSLTNTVTFSTVGTYVLQLTADDGFLSASDVMVVSINSAPTVSAGGDQLVELLHEAVLTGSAQDDGLPAGVPLQILWTLGSGPGEALFANPVSPSTTVRFSQAGIYVLRLAANDSQLSAQDDVTVTVLPVNGTPLVNAGPKQLVLLDETCTLRGWVEDDGLPWGASVTACWTKTSGPGEAVFTDPMLTHTTVRFTAAGNYVLRLTASDTALPNYAEVTLAVRTPAMNEPPVVQAGPDRVVGLTNTLTLTATVTDDGLPRGVPFALEWTLVSGPGAVQFADAQARSTKASFSALGTYVLRLTASDSQLSGADEVAVTVFPLNQPPVVDAGPDQSITIPDPALLLSDGSMPLDPKAILSRSLLAAPQWSRTFGVPGVSGLPVNAVNAWVTRNGLEMDQGTLYLTGTFTNAGGIYAKSAARFDGTNWLNFYDTNLIADAGGGHGGGGTGGIVGWLVYDCAPGDFCGEDFGCMAARNGEVFVGGTYYKDLDGVDRLKDCTDRWAEGRWHSWGFKDIEGIARVIRATEDRVYLGGNFAFQPTNTAYEILTNLPVSYGVAAWDGTNWLTLGEGVRDFRDSSVATKNPFWYDLFYTDITALAVGKTGEVYAAGEFIMSTPFGYATNIAWWDGHFWRPMGYGISDNGSGLHMISMAVADNGDLYVGGSFTNAGGLYARCIARWDGSQWHTLGTGPLNGVNRSVEAVVVNGRDVYVGGVFTEAGGVSVRSVAKWNGEFWSPLGSGPTNGVSGGIYAMAIDETGLYVGGMYITSAGGFAATNLAKWEFNPPPERDVLLSGRVTDDGLPADAALTAQWNKVSGPGEVTFTQPNQAVTRARFSALGTYVLRLTASDSDLTALDEATITVRGNEPPVVDAGPDQVLGFSEAAVLAGVVSDDGLPENAGLPFVWSFVSGPGTALFGNQSGTNTTVRFSTVGTYVLRLTANDSQFSIYDDVVITVIPYNYPPYAHPGSSRTVTFGTPAVFTTVGLYDDGKPLNVTNILWSQVSGPGIINFDNPTGQTSTVTFSLPGAYVIRLLVNDTELASYIDVSVTVTLGNNTLPMVNAGADQTNSTLVTTMLGSFSDDGLPEASPLWVYWTKSNGPGDAVFADSNAPVTTVTFSKAGTYYLRLTASDGVFSRYDDMIVYTPNQPPLVNAGPDRTIVSPTTSLLLSGSTIDDGQSYAVPSPTWARVSGPGTITFSAPYAYTNTVTFSATGTYVLSLTAYDGYVRSTGFVTVVVAPPGNLPPVVDAGSDAVLVWPSTNLTLAGSLRDDGVPSGSSPAAVWTKVSGPGEVSFADATSPVTAATFSSFGKYVLRLTGSDSVLVNGDDVVVELKPAANAAPLVVLGPSQTVRVTNTLALTDTVSDDGLPLGSTLGVLWQKVSGPGPIYFTGATNMTTNRDTSVRFVIPGSYVLRLTANDSQLRTSADLAVAVLPDDDNLPPTVDAGPDFSAPTYLPQHLLGTVTDDGLPPNGFITTAWTKASGPAHVYFGNAAALDTTATFYVTGVYVLRLTATDGRSTRYDDVTVTVTPAPNEPPFAYAGEDVTVVRPKPALLAAAVFDDNLPVGYPLDYQWTMVSGPGVATVVPASGVASNLYINALANFSATGTYVLRLTATDSQFTDFDEVTVTVLPGTNAPPLVNAGPDLTAVLSQPAILHTEASDDGLETGFLEVSWSQVSGSGAAYFSTVDGVYQASFSAAGDYVLRLTASDGTLSASDDVAITVYAATNPPLVQILSPLDAASITAPTVVTGTVSSDILQRWTLEYRLKPAGDADGFPLPGGTAI